MNVVGACPPLVDHRIGTNHMVIGKQVGVTELLDTLGVGAHRTNVTTELGLGEYDADLHQVLATQAVNPIPTSGTYQVHRIARPQAYARPVTAVGQKD